MGLGALLPVIGLAAFGMALAGLGALLASHLSRRPNAAGLLPLLLAAGLAVACSVPFAWVAWFGRG